jgi:hypothetical protein
MFFRKLHFVSARSLCYIMDNIATNPWKKFVKKNQTENIGKQKINRTLANNPWKGFKKKSSMLIGPDWSMNTEIM